MLIAGIDISKTHYAIVIKEIFADTGISSINYSFAMTTKNLVKQAEKKGFQAHYIRNFTWWKKNVTNNPHDYNCYLCKSIGAALEKDLKYFVSTGRAHTDDKFIAFEGYAFAGSGQLLQIAEVTSIAKQLFYQHNWKIRIHDPLTVKLWATGHGNAEKDLLKKNAIEDGLEIPPFLFNHVISYDICDAYFLMKIMETELQVRKNPMLMNDLNDNQKRIFNRVTKSYPTNLLDRSFIYNFDLRK